MLIDTTLREGEQCFGVYFPMTAKKSVLTRLTRLGVEEIELGVAGRDESLAEVMAFAKSLPERPRLSVWAACREKDLEAGAALDPDRLHLGLPVSDPHLRKRLKLSRGQLLDHLRAHVALARSLGVAYVSVGLEDASRADRDFLLAAALAAQEAGAARVRLSDTVGIWQPLAAAEITAWLKARVGLAVGLHCHNDFGLGTANALAGLLSGADFADGSVLGLGERAGLARLEELVAYLHFRLGEPYQVAELPGLGQEVATAAGMEIPKHKAVVGAGIFACETGLHVHGLGQDPELFEAFPPEALGRARQCALGMKSGRAAVLMKLDEMGLVPKDMDIEGLVHRVRAKAKGLGRPLTEAEVREILAGK